MDQSSIVLRDTLHVSRTTRMAFPSILLWNHNERTPACQGRLGQFLVTSQEAALARVAVVLSPVWFVWSLWFIWFVWFVSFVWLNQTNQINQINKTNQMNQMNQRDQTNKTGESTTATRARAASWDVTKNCPSRP